MIHWRDGAYEDGDIRLRLDGPAFCYGTGLFETLAHNGSRLCHPDRHLDRMHRSLEALGIRHIRLKRQQTGEVIDDLLQRNGLADQPARVNIYAFPDRADAPCSQVIAVRPHAPTPEKTHRLTLWPDQHLTSLARHKTMNYAFHALALQAAKSAGYDGCVLCDSGLNLLETTTAALVFRDGEQLVTPSSEPKLPSTALAVARTVLDIRDRTIHQRDLPSFEHAYVLNSLMGMQPVANIDNNEYEPDQAACETATRAILCL